MYDYDLLHLSKLFVDYQAVWQNNLVKISFFNKTIFIKLITINFRSFSYLTTRLKALLLPKLAI
jgi:hypothetical protein